MTGTTRRAILLGNIKESLRTVEGILTASGFICLTFTIGANTPRELERHPVDVVFLCADDPAFKTPGFFSRLFKRRKRLASPLILFGGKRSGRSVAELLDAGADDYWVLPLRGEVAMAYLRAILRRARRALPPSKSKEEKFRGLSLNAAAHEVFLDGRPLRLRTKEFELLALFFENKGTAFSRAALMEKVWGQEWFGKSRTVDFHIAQLRRKLGRWGQNIETIPGVGYRLTTPS